MNYYLTKFVFILYILITLSCSPDREYQDNFFISPEDTLTQDGDKELMLLLSKDTVEIEENVIFKVKSQNLIIDSIRFNFDSTGKSEKTFTNSVKSYSYSYSDTGSYKPYIKVYSGRFSYSRNAEIMVVEKGANLEIDTVSVDTTDSIDDGYEEDTTLSIGSRPYIAFKDREDTLYFVAGDKFHAPGAYAYDEEDGLINEIDVKYDSTLTNLNNKLLRATEAYITYTAEDSHGNIATRKRLCIIENYTYQYLYDLTNPSDTIINDYYKENVDVNYNNNILTKDSNDIYHGFFSSLDSSDFTIVIDVQHIISDTSQSIFQMSFANDYNIIHLYTDNDSLGVNITDNAKVTHKYKVSGLNNSSHSIIYTMNQDSLFLYLGGQKVLTKSFEHQLRYLNFDYKINIGSNKEDDKYYKGQISKIQLLSVFSSQNEIDYLSNYD